MLSSSFGGSGGDLLMFTWPLLILCFIKMFIISVPMIVSCMRFMHIFVILCSASGTFFWILTENCYFNLFPFFFVNCAFLRHYLLNYFLACCCVEEPNMVFHDVAFLPSRAGFPPHFLKLR